VLGTVSPAIAMAWGLPKHCQVHVGVHDSNACLARYLPTSGDQSSSSQALTVVSSGTWTVLMAPGAPTATLKIEHDMLANVDVLGRTTPTARFMGGRDFALLLDGARPDAGSLQIIQRLVDLGVFAMPSFAANMVSKSAADNSLDVLVIQHGQHLQQSLSSTSHQVNAQHLQLCIALYTQLGWLRNYGKAVLW
jgi:sugar (pentulose or hexulose) kinase